MSEGNALIGHTGFVGSNLLAAGGYEATFNSRSIGEIVNRRFERIVCAGVSAKKWIANREPEADRAAIGGLIEKLKTVEAERFVLISTVDVFADSAGADEATVPNRDGLHPYGLHRLELEDFVASHFSNALVLRLPALFGPGLRKNVLFDLINDNMLEAINPNTAFQWYPVPRLASDIAIAEKADLPLVHLATEPLPTRMILDGLFADKKVGPGNPTTARYDLRTRYASIFGGQDPYVMPKDDVLAEIANFVKHEPRQ